MERATNEKGWYEIVSVTSSVVGARSVQAVARKADIGKKYGGKFPQSEGSHLSS